MIPVILDWISKNYIQIIEVIGTVLSIVYVFLSIKQNILLWPVGLAASAIYIYIFFIYKIYADMSLQLYYVVISIYGWYFWLQKTNSSEKSNLKPKKTSCNVLIILALVISILFVAISQVLINFTDSQIPYWDAFTTSASIVATWMLVKKYIEHWYIWIVVDIISSGLYFYKELYFTVFLYIVYTIMAIIGYFEWNKSVVNRYYSQ